MGRNGAYQHVREEHYCSGPMKYQAA